MNRANRVLAFEYDDLYQLIREADSFRNSGSPVVYAYDAMGNRTRKVDNGITTDYTVDKLNRVTAAATGEEVVTYTCDANGNTATKTAGGVTRTYHYDRENRLVRVSEGGEDIFSAVYDYRSRRLEKHENGDTVSYLYDGGVSVQEYDAEGFLKTALIRAGGYGGGIGDVVYTEKADGSGREYFLYNATGTTSALTDDSGAVTGTSCYTAWGTETAATGETGNVRKFSTKERSELLGIDYFGFRYYDPDLGRFLTRDPSGYPDGPNNYLYCGNSPVNKIDPLGLKSNEALLKEREEGLKRQREREKQERESNSLSSIADRRIEAYGGSPQERDDARKAGAALKTGASIASTSAEVIAEFHPVTPVMKTITGRDTDGSRLSAGERAWEAATAIPAVAILDKGIDAAKGIKKAVKAGEKLTDTQVGGIKKAAGKVDDYVDLTDIKAKQHILEGERRANGTYAEGHRFGTGFPGKSEFPKDWSDEKILHTVSDIVTDPKIKWGTIDPKTGYTTTTKTVDGIAVRVVYDTKNGRVVSGYPTNTPRNLK